MSFVLIPGGDAQISRFAADSLVYGLDVTGRLATGDTIASCSAVVVGTGISAGVATFTGNIIKARISGAAAGTVGVVLFECITAGGDTISRPLYFNTIS